MPDSLAPIWVVAPAVCAAASLGAFVAYGLDKRRAEKGAWRVRERTLHLWALAGGWPGALLAQKLFRHKTRKRSFRVVFWLTVAASVAGWSALIWWLA